MITKTLDDKLPTIGILLFEGFLANEIVAPVDVFTKHDKTGDKLFNVVLVARERKTYVSEEGLQVLPDMTFDEAPELNVLIIPSSYKPDEQVADSSLIDFIRDQNQTTDYIASHCAGAFLIGEAGIAGQSKIVTYEGGGEKLKADYPELQVMNDKAHAVMRDGKFFSSNGSLVSYPASLELLEELTNHAHRAHVEAELLYHKLK